MEKHHTLKSKDLPCFPRCNGLRGAEYLAKVADSVSKHRYEKLYLKSPAGATLTIGPLEDTEYRDKPSEVDGCSIFYFPTKLNLQVIGYVEGVPFTCEQLILMICDDGKVYGYDGDEMHLVASSVEQLLKVGIEFPGSKSCYYGEAFKDMTKEDWDKVRNGPVAKQLDQEHREMVASRKTRVSEIIRLNKLKQKSVRQKCSSLPGPISQQKGGTSFNSTIPC